jgi:hypothetical protein
MDIRLVPVGRTAWRIESEHDLQGELRKIGGLFVLNSIRRLATR